MEVAGICDLAPSVAECAAERHRVARWFTDHRAMLAEVRPAVVHVTTPPGSHFRLAMDALEAGAHVILEKPATATLVELEQLVTPRRAVEPGAGGGLQLPLQRAPQQDPRPHRVGQLGSVMHVEVSICLDILGAGRLRRPQRAPSPCLSGAAPSPTSSPTSPRWPTSSSARTARSARSGPSGSATVLP